MSVPMSMKLETSMVSNERILSQSQQLKMMGSLHKMSLPFKNMKSRKILIAFEDA